MDAEFLKEDNALAPTKFVGANFGCLLLVWASVFLFLVFGVKWTGRFAYMTMGLPIALLFALLVKLEDMDGASDGVDAYIGKWDFNTLSSYPGQWSLAVSQIFYSLSVTFGIMTAYGSYNQRNQNIVQDCVIIGVSNSLFSFIAGFAVFGTVGHLAYVQGVKISDLEVGGPGLMFGTYPLALQTLPGGEHWNRVLFLVVYFLGIDSAFSLCEANITVLKDTVWFAKTPRPLIVGTVCSFAVLCGLPYCTDAALILLDVVDYYINFVVLFVGFLESFSASWLYKIDGQCQRLGLRATVCFLLNFNMAVVAGASAAFSIGGSTGTSVGILFAVGFGVVGMTLSLVMIEKRDGVHESELVWDLFFGNVEQLRTDLNNVVASEKQWRVPFIWSFLIKFLIPPTLLILIFNSLAEETPLGKPKFGNYADYAWGYQFIGIAISLVALIIVSVGVIFPQVFSCLAPLDDQDTVTGSN